ncbi:Alpha-D-ribose 1-methylphosphonate 5-triphosphate synthase subunit PhnG [Ruegeria denitrificans]|uniref:Alpha-D-ribose 1-methylphosphonate 5-triphosphate synthase subunit PhnG n=1 Tax=Ruegeria denitrificans TaxID=1715692 RepID=A0A0N7MAL3_9RHOB|nr:phosphonate C-P lyase system protein PhnG [Ruegeria denitrificans]CUK13140.1 Alpha-D-ribose 1-methylphosphonate 5-triphosphate synthase subunit PhnG [Ruegeria denitrificans]
MTDQTKTANSERQDWMGLLARAPEDVLMELWAEMGGHPRFEWLRSPEVGGVMVRGRTGGTGAPFNLGEVTVTRCTLVLQDGMVGHGYVQGRSKRKAEVAALIDALMQTESADEVRARVITPLGCRMQAVKTARAAKAAATKVEFFTMARGEN